MIFRLSLAQKFTAVLVAASFACAGLAAAQQKPAAMPGAKSATTAPKKDEPQISAPHAILIEAESGSVLFERSADEMLYPASLAKLMTAEFVFNEIKQGRVKLSDEYVVSENAWRKGGAPSGGSTMYAAIHSRVPVADLIRGMIIQSGNDACIVLAEAIAGNEGAFAQKMTQRAREIGLSKSYFSNSTGLHDPSLQVTARELGMLARHIIRTYPDLYEIYGEKEFAWNKIRQQNRNPLLGTVDGADGMKTGFTKEAGYGLVGSAVRNGQRLIVVVNGLKNPNDRADEAKKLLEWGFRTFQSRVLFAEGQPVGDAKVFGGKNGHVALISEAPVRIMVPKAGGEKLVARIVYNGPVPAPVQQGQQVATLKVWRNDVLALQLPLKAAHDVEKGNLTQRAFDAASEMVINLFRSGAQRL
ncbi:MAG: D-alanyl-D-alanine carboxypeptidase [Pseudolabrys sp.]|nr:D-alanyl-D-alanine carboxypeptidase [Pseudolabrys sp.]